MLTQKLHITLLFSIRHQRFLGVLSLPPFGGFGGGPFCNHCRRQDHVKADCPLLAAYNELAVRVGAPTIERPPVLGEAPATPVPPPAPAPSAPPPPRALFEDTNLCAINAKRVTIQPARRLRGERN
ncbi:hypothetical protein NXS19_005668 [Fusarium pseudograminearum]|nr:hypothetical protein NXS19_005668 [Fusarium pseudograminearum]